jgi:uncharacterized protein (TIGR02271 family)
MNYEKIVTLYDTAEHAAQARRSLEAAGFPSNEISTLSSAGLGVGGDKLREPEIWHRLFGRDIEQHEATVYGRTIGSGGSVLTIRVPESEAPKALGILNAHRAVDVQRRAVQEGLLSPSAAPASAPAQPATAARTTGAEEVLRLAEEQLEVGKRLVQEGTTRIRRFVTETPVEKQVNLHEEHVQVIRRVVSDSGSAGNIDWSEKTIEVSETAEEPVITKSAHLTEEVVIRKEGSDQVRTVRDKVRRQQVEVERTPASETATKK